MAVPVFRSVGTPVSAGAAPVTVGLPAGLAVNDVVALVATTLNTSLITMADSGGWAWTLVDGLPIDGSHTERLYVWYALYTGKQTAPLLVPSTDHITAQMGAWSGCSQSSFVVNAEEGGSNATSTATFLFSTAISTNVADCLNLVVCTSVYDSTAPQFSSPFLNTNLTSITTRMNYSTNYGMGGGFGLAEGALATAGPVGTWSTTLAHASAQSYVAFALRPTVSYLLTAASGDFSSAGAGVQSGWAMSGNSGSFSLSVSNPVAALSRQLQAASFAMTGVIASKFLSLVTVEGSFTYSGTDAILSRYVVRELGAYPGSFSVAGGLANKHIDRQGESASFAMGGSEAYSAWGLSANGASFGYAGYAARKVEELLHRGGSYGFVGRDAILKVGKIDEAHPRMALGTGNPLGTNTINEARSGRNG